MDALACIKKYYTPGTALYRILTVHSQAVARRALQVCEAHPELSVDKEFVYEAALLHDIGIFQTNAAGIQCFGTHPYICHGYLGADLLRTEGYPKHALVAERHTGTGLSTTYIQEQGWPLPLNRTYEPISTEEEIICFVDKFYSKTHLEEEKSVEQVCHSLAKWQDTSLSRFQGWCQRFL